MKEVQILLSSYNGERYILEQLESISKQTYPFLKVLVRDDGSKDNTVTIIDNYIKNAKYPAQLLTSTNVGVVRSFFALLDEADTNCNFFSFCDQDDVWNSDKIERAIEKLTKYDSSTPAMICTRTMLTDDVLNPLQAWPPVPNKNLSFFNALVENIAVGATITFNTAALNLLRNSKPDHNNIIMHDWWTYLSISAFGIVLYDSKPSILYRQHSFNLVGGNKSVIDVVRKKFRSYSINKNRRILYKQAKEFHRLYSSDLDYKLRIELENFIAERPTISNKIYYLFTYRLYRQSFINNQLLRLLILRGYI